MNQSHHPGSCPPPMDRRKFLKSVASGALVVAGIAGCGGGGGGGANGGGSLTDAQRLAALDAVKAKLRSLTGSDADARRQEALAFIRSLPEFGASGESGDGSLWARFTDGRLFFLIANEELPTKSAPPLTRTPNGRIGPAGLPGQAKATAVNCRVNVYHNPVPTVRALLADGGYNVSSLTGNVDDLKSISGENVLLIMAHGGVGDDSAGKDVFVFTTVTEVTPSNEAKYAIDLALGHLGYGLVTDIGWIFNPDSTYYAITPSFVERYMSLGTNAFVLIGACSSAGSLAGGFIDEFRRKGASVYAGWTALVKADRNTAAAEYVFDRLLGTNAVGPSETPDQRPFDYELLKADMARKGLDTSGAAKFVFLPLRGDFGLLAPSIEYMDMVEHEDKLVLTGKFGSTRGRVEVDRSDRPILSWSKEKIEVRIPRWGQGSAGDVAVFVGDRESNHRLLSDWRIALNARQESEDPFKWEGPLNIHIRADVGSYRKDAGDAPEYRDKVLFRAAGDTTGSWTASGSKEYPGTGTITWSGTSNLVNGEFQQGAANPIICYGEFYPAARRLKMALFAYASQGMLANGAPLPGATGELHGPFSATDAMTSLNLTLNDQFGIIGDQHEEHPETYVFTMSWQTTDPSFPPDDDYARSA